MKTNLLLNLGFLTLIIIITVIIILNYCQEYILNNVFKSLNYENEKVSDEIIIETNYGNIKGFGKQENGFQFYQFLGIPFAEPPMKQKRLRKPKPIVEKWKGVYVADRWPDFCKQINLKQYEYLTPVLNYNTSEDCLYLNIWTPIDLFDNRTQLVPKPVIVYIHGGAFMFMGTSFDIFNGGVFSSLGDVVLVTINYRVGVFGFLDTGAEETDEETNEEVSKNIGLFDQIMALNWIRDNIKNFGGDPNCVTLMGQSAGAISIGLLMSSPMASHLFDRAILESSSPMQMKFFFQISQNNYKRVLQLTNCSDIHCLRELNENDLNGVHDVLMNDSLTGFSPSIPSQLLPYFPREAFDENTAENDIQQKQILLGSNSEEGTIFLHHIRPEEFPLDRLPTIDGEGVIQLFKELSANFQTNLSHTQLKMLVENTLGINGETPTDIRQQLSTVIGDFLFKCPVIKMADSLSEWPNVTVHMYYFTERSGNWPEWIGSSHFEEVQFVFGYPLRYPHMYSVKQQEFTRRLIKTWTEFARNGQMLPQLGKDWPKYTAESGQHMELNSERSSIGVKLNQNYYLLYEIGFETIQ